MQFSPDIIQNMLNGVAQIDLGSTGSGFTNSSISQRYAQVDVTRHFETFIDSLQLGVKWRDGKIHRETGAFRMVFRRGEYTEVSGYTGRCAGAAGNLFPQFAGQYRRRVRDDRFPGNQYLEIYRLFEPNL
ncbi:TonB-dependent receptor [Sphingomonas paucimobilis]|nr:TonB-dependent receptor [Sphingomonas paucimobilis]